MSAKGANMSAKDATMRATDGPIRTKHVTMTAVAATGDYHERKSRDLERSGRAHGGGTTVPVRFP